jgi:hypothetical protein
MTTEELEAARDALEEALSERPCYSPNFRPHESRDWQAPVCEGRHRSPETRPQRAASRKVARLDLDGNVRRRDGRGEQ